MKTLRLILGDQLNYQHSWFDQKNNDIVYFIAEMRQETDYVKHHIQKVVGFFAAMRSFTEWLKKEGHEVIYYKINDGENTQKLPENILQLIDSEKIEKFEYQLPDEYRLDVQLKEFCEKLEIQYEVYDTEHFLSDRLEVEETFRGKKQYLMETFYRKMRKKYELLMDNGQPEGGDWNYDEENRKPWKEGTSIPDRNFEFNDVSEILSEVEKSGAQTFGEIDPERFIWPVERSQAEKALKRFVNDFLPNFGKFQDALAQDKDFLFHSLLSFALNSKILSPKEVIEKAIDAYRTRDDISLAAIEGFVRQIIGWREFMRGIYWAKMPDYEHKNFFDHDRELPEWYWTGETKMNCLKQSIKGSLKNAYAHHIQRLMVTGNFALLAGIDPDDLDKWYLGIYIDAIQWVEITNTRGMSQFADGGIVGTKPYVSSSNYINKMGNYCKNCSYSQSKKTGENACPFNSLYWNFYDRHWDKLEKNPRIAMMYRTWDRMGNEKQEEYLSQAQHYLKNINNL
ncbi:MAG: cryptochrome/photolyase family protein [Bacteroidota bacterium]